MPTLPPLFDHAARGAAFGALVGGGIATVGWFIRQRNTVTIDLDVPAPNIMANHRPLAETLLYFKNVSHHSPMTQTLYAHIVKDCEYVAQHNAATGASQVAVQKRYTCAISLAKRLAREAFKHRDPSAHDCRMQIQALEAHLGAIQKNMMIV